jgi:hypothetical protein
MSSHLHREIARARQDELAYRTVHAHHRHDAATPNPASPRRAVRRRLRRTAAALSLCLAAATAVTVTGADANPHAAKAPSHASAQRFASETTALRAKGYVPEYCTVAGMLMRSYHTRQFALVKW